MNRQILMISLLFLGALSALFYVPAQVQAEDNAAYRAKVEKQFSDWLKQVEKEALQQGIRPDVFQKAVAGIKLRWDLPDLQLPGKAPQVETKKSSKKNHQPEFASPGLYFPEKHLRNLTLQARQKHKEWGPILEKIEKEYGVDSDIVLAIWGRETAFGAHKPPFYVIEVVATQAFMGRRKDMFYQQLMIGLQILQDGHISTDKMKGSWAGAMGYTQFMPEDFSKYAVDFNGDGRRDIWGTVSDALASTANSLKKNGWDAAKKWGYEVHIPETFDCRLEGFDYGRPVRDWLKMGVVPAHQHSFTKEQLEHNAYMLFPAGVKGPSFMVTDNFLVIKTYNMANLYAIFIGHLSERVKKDRDFARQWPERQSFDRDYMREVQTRLTGLGYEHGKIDGILGPKASVAFGAFQSKNGLPVSCYPDQKTIQMIDKKTSLTSR